MQIDARLPRPLTAALRDRLLIAAEATERAAIEELIRTPGWLRCFVYAHKTVPAATSAVLTYASYAPVGIGPTSEEEAAPLTGERAMGAREDDAPEDEAIVSLTVRLFLIGCSRLLWV